MQRHVVLDNWLLPQDTAQSIVVALHCRSVPGVQTTPQCHVLDESHHDSLREHEKVRHACNVANSAQHGARGL